MAAVEETGGERFVDEIIKHATDACVHTYTHTWKRIRQGTLYVTTQATPCSQCICLVNKVAARGKGCRGCGERECG